MLWLTGDTFDQEVKNPTKEFFVWFLHVSKQETARWRPFMYEIAEKYENVTDLVFAELDQDQNEPFGL